METGWVSYFKLEISDLAVGCWRDVARPVANASTCSHYLFECLVHAFDRSSGASISTDQALVKFIEAARIRFAARHALKCDRRKDFSTERLLHMCGLR